MQGIRMKANRVPRWSYKLRRGQVARMPTELSEDASLAALAAKLGL